MPGRPKQSNANADPYPPGWEPFLASIREDLDDDTPRLVFADWLQENGDEARAEFIRLQCAASRGDKSDESRVADLLRQHRRRWLRGLPQSLTDNQSRCTFRRGFPFAITLKGFRFASDGETICRLIPLEFLTLEEASPELLKHKTFVGLPGLELPKVNSALVDALAESPVIPSLRELSLAPLWGVRVSQRSVRKLLASPNLTRLRRFKMDRIPLGNLVATSLAAAAHLKGLEELELSYADFDGHGMATLAGSPLSANLRVLRLAANDVGPDGVEHLVRSPHLRNLVELDLCWCTIPSKSAPLLADWTGLRSVRVLDLSRNGFRPRDRELIAESPNAGNLTELRL